MLEWIRQHEETGAPPPSLDEICEGVGTKSRGSLHKHVTALAQAGLVEPMRGLRRGVRLRRPFEELDVAITGTIVANRAMGRKGEADRLELRVPEGSGAGRYALNVMGEGLAAEGILEGDILVVEPRDEPVQGEVVLVRIGQGRLTVKKVWKAGSGAKAMELGKVCAKTGSEAREAGEVSILGIVTWQLRSHGVEG